MIKATCYASFNALTEAVAHLLKTHMALEHQPPGLYGVMLAGGSTPNATYNEIGQNPFPIGDRLRVLFSDDRHVPPDHRSSNYGKARFMLSGLGLKPAHVLRVYGELPLEQAAAKYQQSLDSFLRQGGRITLGLLGLGADGHTAGLFRDDDLERGRGKWAIATARPDGLSGITVTPDLLAKVERLIFIVSGTEKLAIARHLLHTGSQVVARSAVQGCRDVEVWTDKEAWPLG